MTATPTAPAPTNLLPDLVALPASAPTVQVRDDGLRLRFTSSLGNVGLGLIEVRPNQNQPCLVGQQNSTRSSISTTTATAARPTTPAST